MHMLKSELPPLLMLQQVRRHPTKYQCNRPWMQSNRWSPGFSVGFLYLEAVRQKVRVAVQVKVKAMLSPEKV